MAADAGVGRQGSDAQRGRSEEEPRQPTRARGGRASAPGVSARRRGCDAQRLRSEAELLQPARAWGGEAAAPGASAGR